ncbi:MAG TPA: AAA family ATPase [Gemmatimonadales bacterium]
MVDAARFEELTARNGVGALNEAMALYQGDLLEGLRLEDPAFEEWLQVNRERLRSRAIGALRKLLAEHVRAKATDLAVQVALRLLTFEPFDEAIHRRLMGLYAESGRPNVAMRQYELCVDVLARELGVEPEAATRALYQRLLIERGTRPKAPATSRGVRKQGARGMRRRGSLPQPATPLIGRGGDFEWFTTLWKRARHGQPQLALVLGEAGIGKSRFVGELASHDDFRQADFLFGRGREGEDILPFGPWVEALRPVLSQDLLARLTPITRLDLARLFPEVADGAIPPPSGIEDGPRIFEAVAQLLRLLAAEQPLIVVIEDLHWCDDMTLRLLRFLPRRLGGQPVVLIGTARPEELSEASRRGAALKVLKRDESCVSTTLGPLPREQALQLFRAVLAAREADLSMPLAERVWQLSEGNPFVVLECARALRERSTAARDVPLALPDEVRALTVRQLAHLSDGAARVVDTAAIIGRDFDVPLMARAAGLTQMELAVGLEELVRRQVFRELEGRFDFRHDRVREAAYAGLMGPRRSVLHLQVAQALEAVYMSDLDPHCAAIGAHYRQASVWPEAADYLARAGFQAWNRGAGREALACFESALHAIGFVPDTEHWRALHVHLRLAINGAHLAIGSYERGRQHLYAAENLAKTLSDRRWDGLVAAALCNSLRAGAAHERSLSFGRRALEISREIGDRPLACVAKFVLGAEENNVSMYRQSLEHLLSLLDADVPGPDLKGPFLSQVDRLQGVRAASRHWIVVNCVELGEFALGMRIVEEWLRETANTRDALGTSRIMAYIARGRLHNAIGDFDTAVRAYEIALHSYREDCHGPYYRPLSWGLGLAYALAGHIDKGLQRLENDAAKEDKIGSKTFREQLMLHLGRALMAAGRLQDASRAASEALSWSKDHDDPAGVAGAHALLGEIARLREPTEYEVIKHHLTESLSIAEQREMRPLAARCHLGLAWLYERTGRREHESHRASAASLLAQMGNPRSLDAAGVH